MKKEDEVRSKEWNPLEQMTPIIEGVLLTEEGRERPDAVVDQYEKTYLAFREANPAELLCIPETGISAKEWERRLFSTKGVIKQRRLDNIGKDFLAFIYWSELFRETIRSGEIDRISKLIICKDRREEEFANKDNTLIIIEALDNMLRLHGCNLKRKEKTVLFTDASRGKENYVSDMIVSTCLFSKLVRAISVAFQEGVEFTEIREISPAAFHLDNKIIIPSMGDGTWNTFVEAFTIAANREFRLWDKFRKYGFPSLRQISDYSLVPYSVLLCIRDHRESALGYKGTSFLHRISARTAENIRTELTEELIKAKKEEEI